jgi:hypothetical protein
MAISLQLSPAARLAETGKSATCDLLDLPSVLIRRRLALWGKPLLRSLGAVASPQPMEFLHSGTVEAASYQGMASAMP